MVLNSIIHDHLDDDGFVVKIIGSI